MTEANPYENATSRNTSTDWLNDQQTVDLDLDGMADYAERMTIIEGNLGNELGYINDLFQVPLSAWEGPVLGEAEYVRTRMGDNATELSQYIQRLRIALTNIGMAAQTIADAYGSTDGWSAASLNTVMFAFAERGATRPEGLPAFITGETFEDKIAEMQAANNGAPGANSPEWGRPETWEQRENADGSVTQIATTSDGHRMVITTSPPGVYPATTTTTIYGPNGNRISSSGTRVSTSSSPYHVTTTTTNTENGQVTGSTERTRVAGTGTETVVTRNAEGNETDRRTVTTEVHDDGSQTITTRNAEGEVTDQVTIGAQTAGGPSGESSPYQRAIDSIPDMY